MIKGKDPDPYLCLTDPEANPGDPKTYGSYGSGTLFYKIMKFYSR
jgi:hypothetical protein